MKPFLKWTGGKYKLKEKIIEHLPTGNRLIEPFVGSGSIFLNTDYPEYILGDSNPDLIQLYNYVKSSGKSFIDYVESLFSFSNREQFYYKNRETFNDPSTSPITKAALFIYLNKHCFSGLYRVNSGGKFNVPYGKYKSPKFPREELLNFYLKSQNATFYTSDFIDTMDLATEKSVVYCDPPYSPLIQKSNFTSYTKDSFGEPEHFKLRDKAIELQNKGIPVIISNHFTPFTLELYKDASKIVTLDVQRNVSCKGDERKKVKELLAIYTP
jgi:DNA adenine methylase